uniref:Uncharacterized protein n=1 Tax=Ditylenchus dipsaci TaxID=166011 RepID=A0A915D4G6_9BILA
MDVNELKTLAFTIPPMYLAMSPVCRNRQQSFARGALMSLIQKGILFAEAKVFSLLADDEMEEHLRRQSVLCLCWSVVT